jgi:hypothetical protein
VSNNGNDMCSMVIWEKNPQTNSLRKPQKQCDFEDYLTLEMIVALGTV